jgi:subtilase family serine protease
MTTLSTARAVIAPGLTFSLSNTVENQGVSYAGPFDVAFHLSTDTTYGNGDDIAFSTIRSVTSLGAGGSSPASTTLMVPSTTPLGNYYICAMADSGNTVTESSETNNTLCTTGTLQVTRADLIMTSVTPNAATVNQGGTLPVTDTVKNQGLVSTLVGFNIRYYLHPSTGVNVAITTPRSVAALAAGASNTATTNLAILATTPPNSYYLCAMADSGGSVIETNESNNTLCSSTRVTVPRPDLVMTALSKAATSVAAGGSFVVSNTVKNQGGSTAGAFEIGFVLSVNNVIGDGDDIAMTPQRSIASLGVGASSAGTTTVTVPGGTAPGVYYIGAIADVNGTVTESREGNNTRVTLGTITVTP